MGVASRVMLALTIIVLRMAAALIEVPKLKLNNGKSIPAIALGTYLGFDENGVIPPKNKQLRDVVREAIDVGYRHFDTASVYLTEAELGEAIRDKIAEGVVAREDVFVTTKLWNTDHSQPEKALRESLSKMGLEYVDLYLMHWPISLNEDYSHADIDYLDTWRSMEELQWAGLARSIGISNFNKYQMSRILMEADTIPAVLQIEVHPQLSQRELVTFAQNEGLVVMGYSPLGSLVSRYGQEVGGPRVDSPPLKAIADRVNKTTPQVVLRWLVERQIIPIAKTVNPSRLEENIDIFDFYLTRDDMETVHAYDCSKRFTLPSFWQNHPNYPFEKVENPSDDPFVKTERESSVDVSKPNVS